MRNKYFWLGLAAAGLAATLAACSGDDSSGANATTSGTTTAAVTAAASASTASPTDLVALKKAPASTASDDPAWSGAAVTTLKTQVIKESKAKADTDVKMQALYSDTDIWFRFQWADATNNNLPNQWAFDGTKFSTVTNVSDRLGLYWEITPVADFAARGCIANCHKPDGQTIDKWFMIAPGPSDVEDLWQWTAANSAVMNQVNDYQLKGAQSGDPTTTAYRESAIVVDPSTAGSGTVSNANATNDGPKVMRDPAKTTPVYGPNYLAVSEVVAVDVTKLKAGDKISKTELAPFAGDRADVDSKTTWAGGQYTVVFHRKLDTGNPDDAKFVPGKTYPFGLAVWDGNDQEDHTVTQVAYHLVIQP
jgi:Ethylbenzene dehydrogenase